MNIHDIKELISIIDQSSSIHTFKLNHEGTKILISNSSGLGQPANEGRERIERLNEKGSLHVEDAEEKNGEQDRIPKDSPDNDASIQYIRSPMVGTFYSSPEPNAKRFVQEGERIDKTTVVCILEAMKLLNEIEAEVNGEVVEILVENGQLVEYDQPLVKVRLD